MKLYKFKALSNLDRVLDIIVNERVYCANYAELNDPFEGQFVSERIVTDEPGIGLILLIAQMNGGKIRRNRTIRELLAAGEGEPRICSFSKDMHDVRMWSHYADSHRGVAIEVDFTGYEKDAHPVEYSPTLKKFGETLLSESPTPFKVLTQKTDHWAYETEHRIIQSSPFYAISGRVTAVVCGTRIESSMVQLLRKVVPKEIAIRMTTLDADGCRVVEDVRKNLLYTTPAPTSE